MSKHSIDIYECPGLLKDTYWSYSQSAVKGLIDL